MNPHREGTPQHALFQRLVLGDPVNLGYYRRIQALERLAPNKGVWKLIRQLPGGQDYSRFKGLPYQLARTEYYQGQGLLVEVEKPLASKEVDLELTGGQLVDAKAWTRTWWEAEMARDQGAEQLDKLETQIRAYLNATSTVTYRLRLEFKYFIPPEVSRLITQLTEGPTAPYPGRLEAQVIG